MISLVKLKCCILENIFEEKNTSITINHEIVYKHILRSESRIILYIIFLLKKKHKKIKNKNICIILVYNHHSASLDSSFR